MAGADATITDPVGPHHASDRNRSRARSARHRSTSRCSDATPATSDDSYRWLIGEDEPRPSAARSATCGARPATATRARSRTREYYCATGRRRRRAQQLGRPEPRLRAARRRRHATTAPTITGIGLTKAAHVYCRAQTDVPDADHRLRRPRGRARGVLRSTWSGSPAQRSSAPTRTTRSPSTETITTGGLRHGRRGDRGDRAPQGARAVQLPADARPGPRRRCAAARVTARTTVWKETFENGTRPTGTPTPQSCSTAATARRGSPAPTRHRRRRRAPGWRGLRPRARPGRLHRRRRRLLDARRT